MEANLMRRLFEFCQCPKCFSGNISIHEILYVIEDCIICHWTFHDVEIMRVSMTASDNEIQPFFCHRIESLGSQIM